MMEWISVEDRLPDETDDVLLYDSQMGVFSGRISYVISHGYFNITHTTGHTANGATHWMPLPEPPKEETK